MMSTLLHARLSGGALQAPLLPRLLGAMCSAQSQSQSQSSLQQQQQQQQHMNGSNGSTAAAATVSNSSSTVSVQQGMLQQLLYTSVAAERKRLGAEHPRLAQVLLDASKGPLDAGDMKEAELLLQEALDIASAQPQSATSSSASVKTRATSRTASVKTGAIKGGMQARVGVTAPLWADIATRLSTVYTTTGRLQVHIMHQHIYAV